MTQQPKAPMPTITGTPDKDEWFFRSAPSGSFTLDGLEGIDSVDFGITKVSDYTYFKQADGGVRVDSVSGASAALKGTLYNVEILYFDYGAQALDLRSYFEPQPTRYIGDATDNYFTARLGKDSFEGGVGVDTVKYEQASGGYRMVVLPDDRVLIGSAMAEGTGLSGGEGMLDELIGVERVAFADKTISIERKVHGTYADLPDALYAFFVVGFSAVPGVAYMDQMAEAYRYWLPAVGEGQAVSEESVGDTVERIVEAFTSKPQFTGVYPQALYRQEGGGYWRYEHDGGKAGAPLVKVEAVSRASYEMQMEALARALVERIVKGSAGEPSKQAAVEDVKGALLYGGEWTIGKVVYTVFGNLASKPLSDGQWGGTAKQFANQVAVAKYYTDILGLSSEDIGTLRAVIEPVTHTADYSSSEDIAQLIGTVLIQTPGL